MRTHLEIEFKQLLTKETYLQIKEDHFSNFKPFTHTNHYLTDQKGILSKNRYSLRVRESNDTYEFTLKIPQGFSKLEINENITKEEFEKLLNHTSFNSQILKKLESIDVHISDLKVLTSLTTHRLEKEYLGGVLCIDESHYQNITDYEIEYEAENEDDGKRIFTELLKAYNLTYQGNCLGKFTRAKQNL